MIRVADLELDETSCEARHGGQLLRMRPKPFELLGCLAGRAGRAVTKDELLGELWPDQVVRADVERAARMLGETHEAARRRQLAELEKRIETHDGYVVLQFHANIARGWR